MNIGYIVVFNTNPVFTDLYYSDTTIDYFALRVYFFYNSVIQFIVFSCTIKNKLIHNI